MIELIERSVHSVQIGDITMEFLCKFYEKECNRKVILLIYNNDGYFTNIAYEEIVNLCDEKELIYFLKYLCRNKCVKAGKDAKEKAELIFKNRSYIYYVLVQNGQELIDGKMKFYSCCDTERLDNIYKNNFVELKEVLKKEGIYHVYFIRFPETKELEETAQHLEWKFNNFACRLNWTKTREGEMKKYLNNFTDLEYEEAKNEILNREAVEECLGANEPRTIFLVGSCVVGGWEVFSDDALSVILHKKLMGLNLDYKIVSVISQPHSDSSMNAILEYDIRCNDIVLFLDYQMDRELADMQLDYIYNNYKGNKWLYSDWPIHTTRTGNELIACALIENIIKPVAEVSESEYDYNILHKGEKQLTNEEAVLLQQYLDSIEKYDKKLFGTVGVCVMSCCPFTKGHYHLVEYASKQVDFLYVFVVEENATFFSIKDRMEMVRRGVKELKNVAVYPSGRFIVTKETFKGYFEREKYPDAVIDVTKDVLNFRKYIAPALRISKRFIGEEPLDYITYQYNQALKEGLADVMEVVEIPRKEVKGGEIISGKTVRQYLEKEDWNKIEQMVPKSTLEYLRNNIDRFKEEERKQQIGDESLHKAIEFIQSHNKIVICGLGDDAKSLMWKLDFRLDVKDIKKLEFYDQKLARLDYSYRGKKVLSFEKLVNEYKDYYMLITTRRFKKDIFYSLVQENVDIEHINIADEYV